MSKGAPASTYLVRGDDPALVAQEVRDLLADLVGERDHALVVEEVGGGPGDDIDVGAIVDACLTPPFLIDQRVVVVRDAGRLLTGDAPRVVEVVQDPLPTTVLVLVGGGGTVPAPLVKAVQAGGQVLDVTTGKPKDRQSWLYEHVRGAPVTLDRDALALLTDHVGEDLGRVEGLLSALTAAYGEGATISEADLVPYLGERGNVPRYQLTDAIDRGEPGQALRVLHRMLDTGSLVPIQVMATLHGHFSNMLVLDGDDVLGERDAAAILGSAPFVAKKALEQSRRLGSTRIAEAINLIAKADLDVRGASGLDSVMVVEILVARFGAPDPAEPPDQAARRSPPLKRSLRQASGPPTAGGPRRGVASTNAFADHGRVVVLCDSIPTPAPRRRTTRTCRHCLVISAPASSPVDSVNWWRSGSPRSPGVRFASRCTPASHVRQACPRASSTLSPDGASPRSSRARSGQRWGWRRP